jgi:hypothetical protein
VKRGTIEADRAQYLATVPVSSRGILRRAFVGKSRAGAVKAKCLDCCHFDREEIANCLVILCPLHPYRPYQARKRSVDAAPSDPGVGS